MDKFFRDKHGRVVVFQKPNVWLWVWVVGMVMTVVTRGQAEAFAGVVATIGLAVWAVLEIV